METKDTEYFLKLAELQITQFNKRRDFEWKIAFGLWGGLMISTGFLLSHSSAVTPESYVSVDTETIDWFLFCLFLTSVWRSLLTSWAHEIDKGFIMFYRECAEDILLKRPATNYKRPSRWRFFIDGWLWIHVFTTGILLYNISKIVSINVI